MFKKMIHDAVLVDIIRDSSRIQRKRYICIPNASDEIFIKIFVYFIANSFHTKIDLDILTPVIFHPH